MASKFGKIQPRTVYKYHNGEGILPVMLKVICPIKQVESMLECYPGPSELNICKYGLQRDSQVKL